MNLILILGILIAMSFVAIRVYIFFVGTPNPKKKVNGKDNSSESSNLKSESFAASSVIQEPIDKPIAKGEAATIIMDDSERISLPLDIYYSDDEKFIDFHFEKYFQALIKRIKKATKSITIYDHVDHLINANSNSDFSDVAKKLLKKKYQMYFGVIEEMVAKKNIKYIRILMIPHIPESLKVVLFNGYKIPEYDKEDLNHQEKTLEAIYEPTVEHCKNMFKNCSNAQLQDNFALYVIHPPFRTISSVIIDSETLIDEIDSTDQNAQSFPDRLDINLGTAEERKLEIEKMSKRFDRLSLSRKRQLEMELFNLLIPADDEEE